MKDIEKHYQNSNLRDCAHKKTFPSFKLAAEFNNHQHKRGSVLRAKGKKIEKMHPYRCNRCRQFHIGHDVRTRQVRLQKQSQRPPLRLHQDEV